MTAQERTSLQFYVQFRERTPGFLDVLKFNVPIVAFWTVLIALTIAFAMWSRVSWAPLIPGLAIGAGLRDVRHLRSTVRIWPWLRGIIDWNEVERRLAPAPAPAQDPT